MTDPIEKLRTFNRPSPAWCLEAERFFCSLQEQVDDLERRVAFYDDPTRPALAPDDCPECEGSGKGHMNGHIQEHCHDCDGTGKVSADEDDDDVAFYRSERDAWQVEAVRLANERDEARQAAEVHIGTDEEILKACQESYQALMDQADEAVASEPDSSWKRVAETLTKERDEAIAQMERAIGERDTLREENLALLYRLSELRADCEQQKENRDKFRSRLQDAKARIQPAPIWQTVTGQAAQSGFYWTEEGGEDAPKLGHWSGGIWGGQVFRFAGPILVPEPREPEDAKGES